MNNHPAKEPVLAALFVDFDNIFISLEQRSKHIANQFAANPDRWLDWLEHSLQKGADRRILIRRCYLNPQSFSSFRPYFIRSAFEVVDCPPLTAQGKTSTDIHLVMDVLDTLSHPTHYSEFIILSGDSDFTPVLLRLRMHNRRTSVISAGFYVSPAYKAACDTLISQDEFTRYGLGISDEDDEPVQQQKTITPKASASLLNKMAKKLYEAAVLPQGIEANELPKIYSDFPEFTKSDQWLGYKSLRKLTEAIVEKSELMIQGDDPWRVRRQETETQTNHHEEKAAIADWIRTVVAKSPTPLTMGSLAGGVIQRFGVGIRNSDWLGAETFKNLLTQLDLGNLKLAANIPGYVYDPERHAVPGPEQPADEQNAVVDSLTTPAGEFTLKYPDLAPLAWKVNQLTETPYLMPEHYAIVLREIAREIEENNSYQWSRTSKTVRDRCVEKGVPVSRGQVNFILTSLYYSGYPLGKEVPVNMTNLTRKLMENTITLCKNAQFQLSDGEIELIHNWMKA
jgi:hypothetical protein